MAAPDEAVDLLGQVVVVARRSLRGPKSERDGHIGAAALLTLAAVFKDIAPGTGGGADDTTNDNGNIDPQIDNASDYRINVDAYGADVTLTKQVRALREFEGKLLKGYQEYIGLLETSGEARDGGGGGGGGGAVFEFTLFRSLLFFLPSLSLFAGAFTKPAPRAAAAARGLIVAKCAALLAGPLRHFNYAYELMQLLVSAAAGAAPLEEATAGAVPGYVAATGALPGGVTARLEQRGLPQKISVSRPLDEKYFHEFFV